MINDYRRAAILIAALLVASSATIAQSASIPTTAASEFIGTWTFTMTNPPNTQQTVKVWDETGRLAASIQVGKFPPNSVTGIMKDGDVLYLSATLRENGQPIWAVIALSMDVGTMRLAQMMQNSQTVKRGTAERRQ